MTDVAVKRVQRLGNFPPCQVLFIIIWIVGGVGGVGYTQTGMGSAWLFV